MKTALQRTATNYVRSSAYVQENPEGQQCTAGVCDSLAVAHHGHERDGEFSQQTVEDRRMTLDGCRGGTLDPQPWQKIRRPLVIANAKG